MNCYAYTFVCRCPSDGEQVIYSLRIESDEMIRVEDLLAELPKEPEFHEPMADRLHKQFGGRQTIVATHRGVHITTTRE